MNPKVYYYTDKEVGVAWPGPDADRPAEYADPRFIWYDWGWPETTDPDEADIFVVRQRLIWLTTEQVYQLPYLSGNEQKHVFFDLGSDGDKACYRDFAGLPAIFFRACVTKNLLLRNPTIIPWPWPVVDIQAEAKQLGVLGQDKKYDVVFKGQITNDMAQAAVDSVAKSKLKSLIDVNKSFFAYMGDDEKRAERAEFLKVMQQGRLHLIPTSVPVGTVRYRLYEGMAIGQVGVSLCDGCVFPFEDRINWDDIVLTIPECSAGDVGPILESWLKGLPDKVLAERGKYARLVWQAWLDRSQWSTVIANEIEMRI
jgi:hypothetical protein